MLTGPPRSRRARPVSDAPIEALLQRTEDLTKGWLLALLERAPLDDAPRILAADLTREGPRLCAALLRAIADESDHRRLEPGGALEPLAARVGDLAGAAGPAATSLAVDALQAVVWSALRAELRDPDPDLITELAERLNQISGLMRAAALGQVTVQGEVSPAPEAAAGTYTPRSPLSSVPSPPAPTTPEPPRPAPLTPEPPPPAPPTPETPPSGGLTWGAPRGRAWEPAARTWTDDAPPPVPDPPAARAWAEPDASEPAALWVGALEDEIHRSAGTPLSLLLAELEDAERIVAIGPGDAESAFGEFARAVRDVARRQDILVSENDARAWIIARDTGRPGAQALGTRIAAAVRAREPWRGAPLSASVGVAVLGEDGRTAAELIDAAEQARFAAAAEGQDVIRVRPGNGSGERD